MNEFDESDIPTLDFIVDQCLKTSFSVNSNSLIEAKHINTKNDKGYGTLTPEFDVSKEFVRYLGILKKFDVCECSTKEDAEFARSNSNTFNFQKQGGFKALYKDLKEKRKRDKLEFKLAESNIKANELNERVAKRNKKETIINIAIGIINIGIFV